MWKAIQAEALSEAEQEPFLLPELQRHVLQCKHLADTLAHVLASRLAAGKNRSQWYRELNSVLDGDLTIAQAARADLAAIRRQDPATTGYLNPLLHFKGFLALQAYRVAHTLWHQDRRLLAHHLQSRVSVVFDVDIHPAARVGRGVFIDHATGVVIGETATVEDDVVILHDVTLGGTGKQRGDRHPKVGSGVFIGAGAKLLGNIRVGQGAKIAAGSVVLSDVPSGSTVAGVPAREVRRRAPVAEDSAATIPTPQVAGNAN